MRILLVEDDAVSRDALKRLLEKWDYEVAVAESLQRGLALLELEHFNAILSDIALPDGTGYALVSEARRRTNNVLAIALSAYPYPEDVHLPKVTGFDHHLQKPIDSARLESILRTESRRVVVT